MTYQIGSAFTAEAENMRLTSVRTASTEFIDPLNPFGFMTLRVNETEYTDPERAGDVTVTRQPEQTGDRLRYTLTLRNEGTAPACIDELAFRFAMNNRFSWGVKGGERVIRHSFVSGDGSFFYFTPCDGHPPYLTVLPLPGTGFELFDTHAPLTLPEQEQEHGPGGVYRALIHAAHEESVAREKGCRWRQPVTALTLRPGEEKNYGFTLGQADSYAAVRDAIYENGQPDIEAVPGLTVPRHTPVTLRVRCREEVSLSAEYPEETEITFLRTEGENSFWQVIFHREGENLLTACWGKGRQSPLEFFVTLPAADLLRLRGRFIADHQVRNSGKWYEGLLAEHNNESGALLTPDNYDLIRSWRIYEVTCDDPGLSKPAFLSGKNAEQPVPEEIEALEYYIAHFVWGGLQRTDAEEYPYGIYGIPDWKTLRDKTDDITTTGQAHLWRIYDYSHLALTYLNLYRIGTRFPEIPMKLDRLTYLDRAYHTFLALYTYPQEIEDWSPLKTGLYNELCITDVMAALEREGRPMAAQRLRSWWLQKCKFFITACQDVFGSEYPFDTTGYESTQALADYGMAYAAGWQKKSKYDERPYTPEQARTFLDYQAQCNTACRGVMENSYHLLGSDYRNCSAHYTLSYMSQMGGQALLEYALYDLEDPFETLRLAYASLLSSWALLNAGDEEGYWFPGKEHNGAAGGGFENAPYGETWLMQPHHRGSWYYSCEIDLGYCGYLRGAATVVAEDPVFGGICYGGMRQGNTVIPTDGVNRRFHWITKEADRRVHVLLQDAEFASVTFRPDGTLDLQLVRVSPTASLTLRRGRQTRTVPIGGRTEMIV